MTIQLEEASKRYRMEWVFRNLSYTFQAGGRYALLGPNGSGKSTLLKVLSGFLSLSRGKASFLNASGQPVSRENVYASVSFAAPYMELIEEFTLLEAIQFHQRFKPFVQHWGPAEVLDLLPFARQKHKQIRNFSSGMKQRLKLALAFSSDTPVLLLDEPTTNLDVQGQQWYLQLVDQLAGNRLVVVASNLREDVVFCQEQIHIMEYK